MADLTVYRHEYQMPAELADFDVAGYVKGALEWIDEVVGPEDTVALSASGGVDSTAVGFLLKEVLGDRLDLLGLSKALREALWQELAGLLDPNLDYSDRNQGLLTAIEDRESARKQILYQRGDLLVRLGQE